MPTEDRQRVPAVTIRGCIDLLTAEVREELSVAEFLRPFQEHGYVVGKSCRTMVERVLGEEGESLDYNTLIAAADEFVACCNGSTEHALDVLEAYTRLSGNQAESRASVHRAERE
jgi:hypothetical protein